MMTIDEAIKHCEEVAEKYCEKVEEGLTADDFCDSCASEHRQLAEWLKELKMLRTEHKARWIPVSERTAEFPCLACDIFKQVFIPIGIVVLNNRCYDGKDFDFNVEKFLKGKEITTYGGEKLYVKPREITAWMPLPEPYQSND